MKFLGHFQEDISSTRMPVIAVTHGPSESDTGNGDFDWPRLVLTSVHPRSPGLSSSLSLNQGREDERPCQQDVDRCTFTFSFDINVILMLLSTGSW